MTREEAIKAIKSHCYFANLVPIGKEALDMAIEALKAEPCEDEIILTKEEYKQLLSSEFDNGYAKGYREALENQEPILSRIKAEIRKLDDINPDYPMDRTIHISRNEVLQIIDKYKAESEVQE
jgi:hypothetical protein